MPKILVTGATGYLGSTIISFLGNSDFKVYALIRRDSAKEKIKALSEDSILFVEDLYGEGIEKDFDIIIHCATKYRSENPIELADANIALPILVINTFLKKEGYFLNIDTSLDPDTNLYAKTKYLFERLLSSLADKRTISIINLQLEYFFDENEPKSRFLPSLINACLQNKPFDLTHGDQVRDFIHMEDLCKAILVIIKSRESFKTAFTNIDIGSGKGISIKELSLLVKKLTFSDSLLNFGTIPYRENETMFAEADISLLKELGWSNDYDLQSALLKTIKSYK